MQSHGINNNYTVIPNVVKEDLFLNKRKSRGDKINLLFVGNLLQHPKRVLDIIDMMALLKKQGRNFSLDIYGEGSDEQKMHQKIEELGLTEDVHYKGTADRAGIANAMGKADLLFLFSEFENQPCVINEALCCGTPVLVPDIEGIVEFMNEDFGRVFKRLDQNSFLDQMNQMLDTIDQYDRERIRESAVIQFGEEAIAQLFEKFYNSALERW